MRKRIGWLVLWAALVALMAPTAARAQTGNLTEVPPMPFPPGIGGDGMAVLSGPLSHPRYESGGFFLAAQALYWRQGRPVSEQVVAVRGFVDVDGSATGLAPGTLVGSGTPALDVSQVQGPGSFQPGLNVTAGWRFENGTVVQFGWYHLADSRFSATASLAPPGLQGNVQLADTFLFSNVFNFPINYAGNGQNLGVGNPGATFGIWNAASLETINFVQRFDMFDLSGRIPLWQTESYRNYALVGGRAVIMWERFGWRTVDYDVNGLANNGTIADYHNITSNRLYGPHCGIGNEWYLGDTPVGAFSVSVDIEAGLYMDFAKLRAAYELADRSTTARRSRNEAALVPGVEGRLSLWWFPWEAIQLQAGYDFFAFFNTYASRRPIDFNYGTIDPEWYPRYNRLLHGFTFGVAIVF